jgi:hypothetical protein
MNDEASDDRRGDRAGDETTYDRLRGHEEDARNLHRATRDLHQDGSRERPEHQSGRQPGTLKDCRRYGGQCKEHDPAPRRG